VFGGSRTLAALVAAAAALVCAAGADASTTKPARARTALSGLETGVLAQINDVRAEHHLARLHFSPILSAAARQHSQEMAADGYFSHDSADHSVFWKRIERFYGPGGFGYWSVGENLLWSSPDIDPVGALKLWMNSPEHRANLLNGRWREIGISAVHAAAAPGTYDGLDVTIITTDFGVRR
jgi:uncharacterized protein YkwD